MDPQTGVLGSLTADQEARLQLLWMFLLNAFESNSLVYDNTAIPRRSNSLDNPPLSPASFNTTFSTSALSMYSNTNTNIIPPSPTTPITPISPTTLSETQSQSYKPQHQRSLRKLRRRISLNTDSESVSSAAAATTIPRRSSTRKRSLTFQTQSMGGIHLRPSPQNVKVMQRVMATYKISPDELRQGLLGSLKQDHPDSLLLRFLRARKWDVGKAFVMLVSAIAWRTKRMHIDDDILRRGELYALQQSRSLKLDPREQRRGWEFMKQLRMGKNIIHGVDRAGRPIVDIRVRLHRAEDQSDDVLERYVIHTIESVRMLLRPPLVETATLIFDMTDFSMANMDYTPVRFIIKCLENFYPETLARIIIHKAPWFFSGIWKMIKTWMNDSLVSKVHFTKTLSDLERYIPRQNIPSDLGGSDDKYQYHYIEPDADDLAENLPLDTHSPTRNFLLNQRQRIAEEFLETTRLWLQTSAMRDAIGAAVQQDRRAELIEELRINFWKLDPFVRGRCQLDREGVIVGDGIGTINFYPHLRPVTSRSESFGTTSTSAGAAVTSSDSSSGVLSLSSSTLSASHDHGRRRGRDVDLHTGAVNKPDAQQTMSSTTTTTTMNMVNFLLDDSDIDHDDSGDDSGYQARDDFMQEYMDDDAGYGNPSSTAANNTTTINNEMQEWKFPEKEIPQHNYTHAVIATTNDYSDITNTKEDTNANNNNPRSDVDTDTDMDIGTDLDDDDEEIEIHDAVTQKITYPRADGFVGRAAVRLVNV